MKGSVDYRVESQLAILTIDNAPVNALSSGVRQGLFDSMAKALSDDSIKAIVITGKGNSFIAGADISEFSGKMEGAPLHDVLRRMEGSRKPIIAAINGTAFGGGLEVALCCDYRIALQGAQLGLPEVKLGLLPGAGGTQRLPRLIDVEAALRIMVTGETVETQEALSLGMVDRVVSEELIVAAAQFAGELNDRGSPLRKIRDLRDKVEAAKGRPDIFTSARQFVSKISRGEEAPERIIQSVEAAVNVDSFDEGLAIETQNFVKCFKSPQRQALIHVFFNERNATKIPFIPKDTPRKVIAKAAVIGAGTMGGGIAMNFANANIPVKLLDLSVDALEKGIAVIRKNYEASVKRGKLTADALVQRMALIEPVLSYEALADADVIVEAVFENMAIKKEIFSLLDTVAKPGAILATNTSALDIDTIASATKRPQDVVGTHFFSPANVMKLLEIVKGESTSIETLASAMALGKQLKKIAVLAGNCRGFIGNRMLFQYMQQANQLLLEGALPTQIDQALYDFGMKMGPFKMMDLVGLDLGWRERKRSGKFTELTAVADKLCDNNRFGQKNSAGYYRYESGSRDANPDPLVQQLIEDVSIQLGYQRRQISNEEIVERCTLALINEGAKILQEGIAIRSSDIDIVHLHGYGFPAWRGGPMFYAESLGIDVVLQRLTHLQNVHGDFWQPAELIAQLAQSGVRLSKWIRQESVVN